MREAINAGLVICAAIGLSEAYATHTYIWWVVLVLVCVDTLDMIKDEWRYK